jgi:hypothetical protein
MSTDTRVNVNIPEIGIDVIEPGKCARKGRAALDMGLDFSFSTERLQSYAFAKWDPVIFDAMVVAAAVEYSDKIVKRPSTGWARRISLRLPVHDPKKWTAPSVATALQEALEFLTGDFWDLEFVHRSTRAPEPPHEYLFKLPVNTTAVLAYSDGMDSRAVAEILDKTYGQSLVRVRVGSKKWDRQREEIKTRKPFTTVPYNVSCPKRNRESSARS